MKSEANSEIFPGGGGEILKFVIWTGKCRQIGKKFP